MFDKKLIKSVTVGAFCGILTSVILMCILAVALLKVGLLSEPALGYVLSGFVAAGAFVGGFVAAKLNGGAGLIAGAAVSAVMLLALTITAAFRGSADFSLLFIIKAAAALLGGAAGGIIGVREKQSL